MAVLAPAVSMKSSLSEGCAALFVCVCACRGRSPIVPGIFPSVAIFSLSSTDILHDRNPPSHFLVLTLLLVLDIKDEHPSD